MKRGLILDRDEDPWIYVEEGVEILEQTGRVSFPWLSRFCKDGLNPLKTLEDYAPQSLELPEEYML